MVETRLLLLKRLKRAKIGVLFLLVIALIGLLQLETLAHPTPSLVKAYAHTLLHEYPQAVGLYEATLNEGSDLHLLPHIQNNLGNAYYYLGQFSAAETAYNTALDEYRSKDYRSSLGAVLHYNRAHLLSTEDEDRAIYEYRQAIQLHPELLEAYNNLAILLSDQPDKPDNNEGSLSQGLDAAIELENQALALTNQSSTIKAPLIEFNLGNLLFQRAWNDVAETCQQESSSLTDGNQPTNPIGQEELHPINGRTTPDGVISNNPTEEFLHDLEACGSDRDCRLNALRNWQSSTPEPADYSPNIEQFPPTFSGLPPWPHSNRQGNRAQSHQLQAEKRQLETACRYRHKAQFDPAIFHYQAALALNPYFLEALNNLGNTYLETGQFERSIETFKGSIHLDKKAFYAHNNLAVALLKNGQIQAGREQLERLEEIRNTFLLADEQGGLSQRVEISSGLEIGRIGEWSPKYSQTFQATSLSHFTSVDGSFSCPIMTLWNRNQEFQPLDLSITDSPEKDRQLLEHSILSPDSFAASDQKYPVARILAFHYIAQQKGVPPNLGTGFFVKHGDREGLIMTAYHNLLLEKDILDQQIQAQMEADEIVIQLFTPVPEVRQARIIARGVDELGVPDLAILQVQQQPNFSFLAEINSIWHLNPNTSATIVGHSFDRRWHRSNVTLEDITPDGKLILRGGEIGSADSGAPVFLEDTTQVVGLVFAKGLDDISYATTADQLTKALKNLSNSEVHQ
jgi:tetratricopeptide (TPR) repeat protein